MANSKASERRPDWWKGAVFYQVYPRSFLDTNGDGIGDLPGITQKLDYIASLNVDGIWISPFFTSPMKDFGYDISDYRAVDPIFGTLADFDALLKKAHNLNLKIIIDMVFSHTSDQHPWFQESCTDRANPKADWYVWANPKTDEQGNRTPPNNWQSVFGGPAWTYNETRGQYYFHNFLREQPDLNFHNEEVQTAILKTGKFWLERGVDGFRLDVVNFYFHDKHLRDNPPRTKGTKFATQLESDHPYSRQQHVYDKSQPENLEFLARLRALTDQYGAFMVGEIGDDFPYERAAEYTSGNNRLHTTYNPDLMAGQHKALTASLIRRPFEEFMKQPDGGFPAWAFSNHDVVRATSRWHPNRKNFDHDPRLSKMLVALLGTLYGTMFLYQGEELGLPEAVLKREDLQDPWGIALWPEWQGRDGCRTPMPWNDKIYSGFSTAKPWLPPAETHKSLDVETQEGDKNSVLNFTREYLAWRKTQPTLINGTIEFEDTGNDTLLAFTRRDKTQTCFCLFNLASHKQSYKEFDLDPYGFFINHQNTKK